MRLPLLTLLPVFFFFFFSVRTVRAGCSSAEIALANQWNAGNYSAGWLPHDCAQHLLTKDALLGLENWHQNLDLDDVFSTIPRDDQAIEDAKVVGTQTASKEECPQQPDRVPI